MGTNTKTENDNTGDGERLPTSGIAFAALCRTLERILTDAGLTLPQHFIQYVGNLAVALNRFMDNGKLWLRDDDEAKAVLQKHLCFTLIVPAGRADRARMAVDNMTAAGLLPYTNSLSKLDMWPEVSSAISRYARFPQQKVKRVTKALTEWDSRIVPSMKLAGAGAMSKYHMIRCVIDGMGPKASAHFMRNTGLVSGMDVMPIIDTHIIKLLRALGYVNVADGEYEPQSYHQYSDKYMRLARKECVPPLLLDAVAWSAFANNWDMSAADFDNFTRNQSQQNEKS